MLAMTVRKVLYKKSGGRCGIRTHVNLAVNLIFEISAIGLSANLPALRTMFLQAKPSIVFYRLLKIKTT